MYMYMIIQAQPNIDGGLHIYICVDSSQLQLLCENIQPSDIHVHVTLMDAKGVKDESLSQLLTFYLTLNFINLVEHSKGPKDVHPSREDPKQLLSCLQEHAGQRQSRLIQNNDLIPVSVSYRGWGNSDFPSQIYPIFSCVIFPLLDQWHQFLHLKSSDSI